MQKDLVWLFANPSDFARSIGLYILELGHHFQDGQARTLRVPENAYSLFFDPAAKRCTVTRYLTSYPLELDGKEEGYFIHFGGPLAGVYCSQLLEEGKKRREITLSDASVFTETFEQLRQIYVQPSNDRRDTYAVMLLTQLMAKLLLELDPVQSAYARNPYVQRTLEIIEERYTQNLKIRDIAEELDCNPSYLSRIFNEETELSFPLVLAHVRINHAKELLHTTTLSISEISAQCGFCNSSHFVKVFHEYEDITPLQYRMLSKQG